MRSFCAHEMGAMCCSIAILKHQIYPSTIFADIFSSGLTVSRKLFFNDGCGSRNLEHHGDIQDQEREMPFNRRSILSRNKDGATAFRSLHGPCVP